MKALGTGLRARRPIARLIAKLAAVLVWALPRARLSARSAGLATRLPTFAVDAEILTRSRTGRAVMGAGLPALVRADKETLTLMTTRPVEPSLMTLATGTTTTMAALELMPARRSAFKLLNVRFVKAGVYLSVAALQHKCDFHCAGTCCAWNPAEGLARVSAGQRFLARLLAQERLWILVTRNHLHVLTTGDDFLNLHWTRLRARLVTHARALVSQLTHRFPTYLEALELLVLGVVGMAGSGANVATVQTEEARLLAAALRSFVEVVATTRWHLSIRVILTAQG